MRRIFKYGTGQEVPANSKYLNTVVQTRCQQVQNGSPTQQWDRCWLVWHYYEVEQ